MKRAGFSFGAEVCVKALVDHNYRHRTAHRRADDFSFQGVSLAFANTRAPATMASNALAKAFPRALKEVRMHLCQTGQASAGTR